MKKLIIFVMLILCTISVAAQLPSGEPTPPSFDGDVEIKDFEFGPAEITVQVGDTVKWVHTGTTVHTVTADDGSFDSESISGGETFEFTFNEPGEFPYHCNFHGSMQGIVIVEGEEDTTIAGGEPETTPSVVADIEITDFEFSDTEYIISAGDTVTWVHKGSAPHTVTGDGFGSETLNSGQSFTHRFDDPGEYEYQCNFHPSMQGTIVVEGDDEFEDVDTTSSVEDEPAPQPSTPPTAPPSAPVPSAPSLPPAPVSAPPPPQVQQPAPASNLDKEVSQLGTTLTGIAERMEHHETQIDQIKTQQQRLENQITTVPAPVEAAPTFTVPVIILFTLVLAITGYLVFLSFHHNEMHKHVQHLKSQVAPKSKEAQLDHYITGCVRRGMPKAQIKQYLEAHGWDKTMVEQAFSKYK